MSTPEKHHYLPRFFLRRWADSEGRVTEYRRAAGKLQIKRRHPGATAYEKNLYTNETETCPEDRQAFELRFLRRVDEDASKAIIHIEKIGAKPDDPALRDAWSRFLMSLIHRSPQRVRYLAERVQAFEQNELNPDLEQKYAALRGPDDPPTFEEWLAGAGSLTPELKIRLLERMMDSARIGAALNAMLWSVITLSKPRYGFLTGDLPILISNGLGHSKSFVALAIAPARIFIAAHKPAVLQSFASQEMKALENAINDACVRQAQHIIIAQDSAQTSFIEKRFLRQALPLSSYGMPTWNAPLQDFSGM